MTKIYYGEVWFVDLDPTVGHEQAKLRPCLVISTNLFNNGPADLVTVLPITSKFRAISWFVKIELKKRSAFIICNQPRTVSKKRFKNRIEQQLDSKAIEEVRKRLKILLDF